MFRLRHLEHVWSLCATLCEHQVRCRRREILQLGNRENKTKTAGNTRRVSKAAKIAASKPVSRYAWTMQDLHGCTVLTCAKTDPEPSEVTAKISEVKQTLGLAPKCRKVLPWKARYARHSSTSANSNCFCASAVRQSWDLCCQWQWPCEAGPTASHGSNETIQSEAAGDEDPFFNVRVPMVLVP